MCSYISIQFFFARESHYILIYTFFLPACRFYTDSNLDLFLYLSVCGLVGGRRGRGESMKVVMNIVILFLQALQPPISQQVWNTSLEFVFDRKTATYYSVLGVGEILQCSFENIVLS